MVDSISKPELYWISGSPFAWRVMLGMTLKAVPFISKRLDHGAGDNKTPQYLALNPKGQVPTVVYNDTIIRESIAILAWLDHAFPQRPIWGENAAQAAQTWQDVMTFEHDMRPYSTIVAQGLIRGDSQTQAVANAAVLLEKELDAVEARLQQDPFIGGAEAMAADIHLYPTLGWVGRGAELAGKKTPDNIRNILLNRPSLSSWHERMGELSGVIGTWPPHWSE